MAKRRQIAKSAAATATDIAKTTHLLEIQPVSVDAVDAAANKRRFVVVKEAETTTVATSETNAQIVPPPAVESPPVVPVVHEDVAALTKALAMQPGDERVAALLTVAKAIGVHAGTTLVDQAEVAKATAAAARASLTSYSKAVDSVVSALAATPAPEPVTKSKSPEEVTMLEALGRLLARVDDIGKSVDAVIAKAFAPIAAKLETVEKRVNMLGVPSARPSVGSSAALSIEDDAAPAQASGTTWPSDMAADDTDD